MLYHLEVLMLSRGLPLAAALRCSMAVAADAGAASSPTWTGRASSPATANVIPVAYRFVDDCETPVSAFLKLREAFPGPSFLLESAEQGRLGRYSFLGFRPRSSCAGRTAADRDPRRRGRQEPAADPYGAAAEILGRFELAEPEQLPPFAGGAVGFFGYDLVRTVEPLGEPNPDPLGLPDMALMVCELMLAFDHLRHEVTVLGYAFCESEGGLVVAYDHALGLIDEARAAPRPVPPPPSAPPRRREPAGSFAPEGVDGPWRSNLAREHFEANVARIVEYTHAGDAFQVVPSQRFSAPARRGVLDLPRAAHGQPVALHVLPGVRRLPDRRRLARAAGEGDRRRAETRPIAGTYPRGAAEEEDRRQAEALLADPKERAEHVMLVDLGRNDLGRVCDYGTVAVDEYMVVETYSHVFHIVSQVSGRLRDGIGALDVLRATLPAGRSPGRRRCGRCRSSTSSSRTSACSYGGAIGYLSFTGDLDTAIHIRTAVVKDGQVHVQAGGGTVADAKPDYEYRESVNKAKAMFARSSWRPRARRSGE